MRGSMFLVEEAPPRYGVRTPYDPRVVKEFHRIPGPKWDKGRKVWVCTPDAIRPLREHLAACGVELGVYVPYPPEPPPPNGYQPPANLPLRAYQTEAVAFALAADRQSALLALSMGLGKGLAAIAHGLAVGGPRLILYPGIIKSVWAGTGKFPGEIRKWLPDADVRVLKSRKGDPDLLANLTADTWILGNYELLDYHRTDEIDAKGKPILEASGWLKLLQDVKPGFRLIVLDECHAVKNRKGKRTKGVHDVSKAHKEAARLGLTGTPILTKPDDLWGQLAWIHPDRWGGYWDFAKRYCIAQETEFGWSVSGVANADELKNRLRWVAFRRTKAEVTDLPPKVRQVLLVEADEAAAAMNELFQRALEMGGKAPNRQQLLAALHSQGGAKWKAVSDLLEGLSSKAVVFAYRRDTAQGIAEQATKRFPAYTIREVDGEQQATLRQRQIDEFREAPAPAVLVATVGVAGIGIDLSVADTAVFADLDYVPANILQAEDRLYRPPQTRSVTCYYVVIQGSVEEQIARGLAEKLDALQAVLGADPAAAGLQKIAEQMAGTDDPQAQLDALRALLREREL